jgi:hypothetical protein
MPRYIGHHRGYRLAGEGFFCGPEQFGHIGCPYQHKRIGIEPEAVQTRAIGHAHFLSVLDQLQINDGRALPAQEAPGLGQCETEHRPRMAALVGENFL